MATFVHEPGARYLILNGVRRAKAAQVHRHVSIVAEVFDRSGVSLGIGEIPLNALVSPKDRISRKTAADKARWDRVDDGAKQTPLPFPPIFRQPTKRTKTLLVDVVLD